MMERRRKPSLVDPYIEAFVRAAVRQKFARRVDTFALMAEVVMLLDKPERERALIGPKLSARCAAWLQENGCRVSRVNVVMNRQAPAAVTEKSVQRIESRAGQQGDRE